VCTLRETSELRLVAGLGESPVRHVFVEESD
jgi:hypothetical protein